MKSYIWIGWLLVTWNWPPQFQHWKMARSTKIHVHTTMMNHLILDDTRWPELTFNIFRIGWRLHPPSFTSIRLSVRIWPIWPWMTPNRPSTFSASDDDSTHQVSPPYDYPLGFDPSWPWMTPKWPSTFLAWDDDSTHQVSPPYDYPFGFDPVWPWMTPKWPSTFSASDNDSTHQVSFLYDDPLGFDPSWPWMTPKWPSTFSASDDDSTHQVSSPYDYL